MIPPPLFEAILDFSVGYKFNKLQKAIIQNRLGAFIDAPLPKGRKEVVG